MTEENKEVQADSGETYGLAETPFSAYAGTGDEESPEEPKTETEEPVVEPAAEVKVEEAPAVEAAPPAKKEETASHVDYGDTFKTLSEGDVVGGIVVHIDREGVLVDVGAKSEGIIRPHELSREMYANPEDIVQVGDEIEVYVMRSEGGGDENLQLSKKRADFEHAWNKVEEAHKEGKTINAMVSDRVKGGLVVDLGIRGFVPGSHVGSGKMKNLDKFVGQSLPLKVIEVDRERRKVVLSHRLATEEDRESQRADTLATLKEGDIRDGVVRRMTDYGAFIDLGGIDGLLHISEMSWTRINHPSEILKVGDKIQVMVLKLNLDQGRVSLGLRQILPDPWLEVARKYRVGDIIQGKISRLVPFGAFIQVEGGVEAIIPNAELAVKRVSKPEEVVEIGQDVEARVVDLRVEERRMTLSIRNLQQQREREQVSSYTTQTRNEQRTTLGDLVGDALNVAARRGAFGGDAEKEQEEREITKPKPKKRASKAEQRALEEGPAAEEDEIAAMETLEPEAEVAPVEEPVAEAVSAVEEVEATPVEEPLAEAAPVVEVAPVAEEAEAAPVEEPVAEEEKPAEE
jgi:ribosomal protein S1